MGIYAESFNMPYDKDTIEPLDFSTGNNWASLDEWQAEHPSIDDDSTALDHGERLYIRNTYENVCVVMGHPDD